MRGPGRSLPKPQSSSERLENNSRCWSRRCVESQQHRKNIAFDVLFVNNRFDWTYHRQSSCRERVPQRLGVHVLVQVILECWEAYVVYPCQRLQFSLARTHDRFRHPFIGFEWQGIYYFFLKITSQGPFSNKVHVTCQDSLRTVKPQPQ